MTPLSTRLTDLLAQLSLEEKVQLVSGADFWSTVPIERIGLRAMVLSDGPAGVRGARWDEREPSLNLPSATALASSWDIELTRRYGAVAAAEARRKGVDVVLGPTINLHRSPLGGRHFEAFSEDPGLTGELAAAYVSGLQAGGVAATPKHYVGNDSETDRLTVDVRVDDRTLREVYLAPFELAVKAGAWAIMSAYNSVNGVTMTEHDLLSSPLGDEWGFDGVVVSDWTAVRSLAAASAAQDLAMPGPAGAWSEKLLAAVREGQVSESDLDRKVLRLLTLAHRVGALDGSAPAQPARFDGVAFARQAAVDGSVLLRNRDELPWDAERLRRVAVIGHNAEVARTQGGGSATVVPERVITPLDGIRAALPDADVAYAIGAIVQEGVAELPLSQLRDPETGEPGLLVSFLDVEGNELLREHRRSSALVWLGGDAPIGESRRLVLRTTYLPETTEEVRLGFASARSGRVYLDGELRLAETPQVDGTDLGAALLSPPSETVPVSFTADVPVEITAEFDLTGSGSLLDRALSVTLGLAPPSTDPDALIAEAVAAAAAAEVAVVVVGTNSRVESEGYDRSDLSLPGRQDDLVRAVAAANPRTVVVVNAGAPVLLPWRNQVAAILVTYFGGQECGTALADLLLGAAEPGGRLPTTWPATMADVPVLNVTPRDGALDYTEGIHIGYRAWLRSGIEPAYPFGFGLGYTGWRFETAQVEGDPSTGDAVVRVVVTNTGQRAGKQVVQVYAERADSAVDRPVRWLVGFAPVWAAGGAATEVAIPLPARAFAHWDGGWRHEPGEFRLRIGSSVVELPLETTIEVKP
ncbi:glycoside hydrolase family 3 protein [Natronosporangium hydrolyticum]|uniref:Glycoside hydrolase family 3 protein n=1 Tax=Natronosporangium hydrolyticum TaxID=2811111 RepID=A0A895Y979_9ACTN|nr:glycoside hydrolase family 3 C-terminal domain-containing protein [Natronosporangium hydrolyticum]QSB12875.1 glycoside hydrolase family 3 protein [Natronosporangium hydrolyticum]